MAVQAQYNDNDYKNWVRACLGLKFLKEGLVDYVDNEVQTFHTDILINVCGSATCNGCTTDDLTRRPRPLACPSNVCDKIRDRIQTEHRYKGPLWKNTDATKWCTDYWEIAKCFMSTGSKATTSPADADTTGILSVCINALFMPMAGMIIPPQNQPTVDIFHKNRDARNTILHSGSMSLSDTERQDYIQDMIDLLATYKQPVDQVTQEAIVKLTLLNTSIFITSTDEVAALKLAQGAAKIDQQNMESNIATFQKELGRVGCSQHDLGNKVDAMTLEKEQEQIKQKEQLLKLMDAKLLELQTNTNKDISDMRAVNESLLTRNDELHESIVNLVSRVQTLEKGQEYLQKEQETLQRETVNIQKEQVNFQKVQENLHKECVILQKGHEHLQKGHEHLQKGHEHLQMEQANIQKEHENLQKGQENLQTGQLNLHKGQENIQKERIHLQKGHEHLQKGQENIQGEIDVVQNVQGEIQGELQDVICEVQEVKGKVQNLENVQKMNETVHFPETRKTKEDIQRYLLEKYKDLSTMSMPPILQRIKANIDDVYSELLIRDDLVHKKKKQSANNTNSVENYQAVIYDMDKPCKNDSDKSNREDKDKPCKNIFVIGTAGIGKTTWSRKLVCTWCDVISKHECITVSEINKTTLLKYDLVFYIELRRAKTHTHLTEMIEKQLFPHQSALMTHVKTLMENEEDSSRCLIVLDGLDEWVSRAQSSTTDGLPDRDPRWKSTIITTTRSWKLEELDLEPRKIDRAVEIKGLKYGGADQLVKKVITTLNASTGKRKKVEDFRAQCNQSIIGCWDVPLLLNIFVCLWYEEGRIDERLSQTFCGLVELLIKHAEGDSRRGLYQKVSPRMLKNVKKAWKKGQKVVPICLAKRERCSEYALLLSRLGKIAFDNLFSRTREATLVFTYQSINDIISEDELQIALDIGILSQTTHCGGSVLEEEFSLSFLHKTVQEYLAALYMVYDDTQSNACLKTYQKYCTDAYKVLEMENVLMFVSGMCPEVAGKISCHIATMEMNEEVHKLLLRCVRQERMISSTSRQIYIKHHILYSFHGWYRSDEANVYNEMTVDLLREPNDKDITVLVKAKVGEKIVTCLKDIRYDKLIDAAFNLEQTYIEQKKLNKSITGRCKIDLSGCKSLRTVLYQESYIPILLPTEQLEEVVISNYKPTTAPLLDLSGCKSLRTVQYKWSTVPIQLQHTERLEKVEIIDYKASTAPLLDLSGCNSLRKVKYEQSTVPIQLQHTERLEEVEITEYNPSTAVVLDLSGCKSLRSVCCKRSTAPIQLPSKRLEEITIHNYRTNSEFDLYASYGNSTASTQLIILQLHVVTIHSYRPNTAPVVDLSRCKFLKTVCYRQSTVPIQLPTEQLEQVEITGYNPSTAAVLDLSGCKSLRSVCCKWSTAPIQLPSERLEEINIQNYKANSKFDLYASYGNSTAPTQLILLQLHVATIHSYRPNTAPVLDLSRCKFLKKVGYMQSTAPIQLPTEQLEQVEITEYNPNHTAPVLDLSRCKFLKKVCYRQSTAPIQLQHTERLEKVEIIDYTPSTAPLLDLSGCNSLRAVKYKRSTVPIQLQHTERLEEVEITGYTPTTAPVLDLSGCQLLKTVQYEQSTAPIQLPTEQLEKVEITGYTPTIAPILDLSGCQLLKTVLYEQSTPPIQLPTEGMKEVKITGYESRAAPVLDLSGCKSLRTLSYWWSTVPIQLPTEQLEMVELLDCTPNTVSVVDLSKCKFLRSVQYWRSTTPIQLPTEQLEEIDIVRYTPSTVPVLDLSGCKSLRTVRYKQSTAPIHLPSERLEEIHMQNYNMHNCIHTEFDLSARYDHSTTPPRVPTGQHRVVAIGSYQQDSVPVLDLSLCRSLRNVYYKQSTAPIHLPSGNLETVVITNYTPSVASELDLSGCKSLRTVNYKQSTAPIKLPVERMETVKITDYKPSIAPVSRLFREKLHETWFFKQSTAPIQQPTERLREEQIPSYIPSAEQLSTELLEKVKTNRCKPWHGVLDLSGCESLKNVEYRHSAIQIQLPTEQLEWVEIIDYKPSRAPMLDLSGCTSMTVLEYYSSSIPIKLPDKPIDHLSTDESTQRLILKH